MWPWTHAIFGYACYSLAVHAGFRRRPTDLPAIVAVFAAVLPDIIDKPLAWTLGLTTTGYGPAHSILIGAPVATLLAIVVWRTGRREIGLGFLVGYTSHLVGDVIFQLFDEGELVFEVLLWPVAKTGPGSTGGLLVHFVFFLNRYIGQIRTGEASTYLLATMSLTVFVFVLWVLDGFPGVRLLGRLTGR